MSAQPTLSITFLGTRDAAVTPKTFTTSQLLRLGERLVLVDCGRGSADQLWRDGVEARDLDAILLTHWHPDHVAGMPKVLRRASSRQRERPLRLHAPRPPSEAWWQAVRSLTLRRLLTSLDLVTPGESFELDDWRLEALATEHGTPSVGWLVAEQGGAARRLVLSGDTRPVAAVEEAARGASLLVHEATFLERDAAKAVASCHSTAAAAAGLAARAQARALALTHLPTRYTRAEIAAEAEAVFRPVLLPEDLDRLDVTRDGVIHVPAPRASPAAPADSQ